MSYLLRQFTSNDGEEGYEVLQRIGENENDFTNPIHGRSFAEYKEWLAQQDAWSRDEGLPDGYVGQTCFWLVADGVIVGMGKIRHALTARSREEGGTIGIAIDPNQRGKGYGTAFLGLLINKAKEMKVGEILITVKKYNYPSKKASEKNGCFVFKETETWWYLTI